MSVRALGRTRPDEAGVALILVSLAIVAVVPVIALVVDLAQLRTDRRVNKGLADVAAGAGVARLASGPWSGVCEARNFLLGNAPSFSAFDAGSETWSVPTSPPTVLASSPCESTSTAPFTSLCAPGSPDAGTPGTWARLAATARGGRFTIEIQRGYRLPDAPGTGEPTEVMAKRPPALLVRARDSVPAGVELGCQRVDDVVDVGLDEGVNGVVIGRAARRGRSVTEAAPTRQGQEELRDRKGGKYVAMAPRLCQRGTRSASRWTGPRKLAKIVTME